MSFEHQGFTLAVVLKWHNEPFPPCADAKTARYILTVKTETGSLFLQPITRDKERKIKTI